MQQFNYFDFAVYLSCWLLFGIVHTLFASDFLKSKFPLSKRQYRLVYNLSNSLTFLLLLVVVPSPISPLTNWLNRNIGLKVLSFTILSTGGLITLWGLSEWDLLGFLGIKHEENELNTSGPYLLSRHPVYSGLIMIFLALMLVQFNEGSISWFLGAGGYFMLGSKFEEDKLESHFGKQYVEYKNRVPWLFPYKITHIRLLFQSKLELNNNLS